MYGQVDTLQEAQTELANIRTWLNNNMPGQVAPENVEVDLKEIDYWLNNKGDKGDQGEPGAPGIGASSYSAEADSDISAGQPVYLKATGHIGLAQANAIATATVAGFLSAAVLTGHAGTYLKNGPLILTDWMAITGTANLTPGAEYYLDADNPGKLTAIAPTAAGNFVCPVGQATTSTTLAIEIQPKILL